MKQYIYILGLLLLASCYKEKDLMDESVVDKNAVIQNSTELDSWIYDNFTQPYNIEIKYRWDKNALEPGSFTYPPKQEKIQEVLEAVKFILFETYTLPNIGKKDFMKGKSPVRIYMYGGQNLDYNGVELISKPNSSAVEMNIYNVNDFDAKDETKVFILARSIHTQFAKRLMELFPYDRDKFMNISKKRYLSSTAGIEMLDLTQKKLFEISGYANKRGFFTQHSRISPEDDFAEIISITLTNPQTKINEALNNAKTPYDAAGDQEVQQIYNEEAKQAYKEITEKKDMVYDYFEKEIGINIKRMQIISVQRIKAFVNR